jgi:anti-sigma regulatory factor (Ser/Thr protein kinase)
MEAEAVFPAELASAARARHHTETVLRSWGCENLVEPARLLVSELVVNAVLHARSEVVLRLSLRDEVLRVEVVDCSDAPLEQRPVDPTAVSGRGLMIVDALASAWGVDAADDGKVVWFELAVDDVDPTPA